MIYGLNARLFLEDGPTVHADRASRTSSARAFAAWQAMDEAHRLAMVEQALAAAANENSSDGFPVAL